MAEAITSHRRARLDSPSSHRYDRRVRYVAAFLSGMGMGSDHLASQRRLCRLVHNPAGRSVAALWIGGVSDFLVGGIFDALFFHCYNLAGRVLGP